MDEAFVSLIRARYQQVTDRIRSAALKAGRNGDSIRLVVVTKAQPANIVRAALAAGVRVLGENYAEEAVEKMKALKNEYEVEWHMIGHVQGRKAELVARHFSMLHSLDSLKLAGRLERFLSEAGRTLPVLLEFNVGAEASKSGWPAWESASWPDLLVEVAQIVQLPHLRVLGLMTMPPYYENPELSRPYFQRLRRLQEFLGTRIPQASWRELSIGTSVDFEVAVQEGATYVRVGQAILGPRPAG